jgi:Flp pilus assembly protein TadD
LTHGSDLFAGATESTRQAQRRNPDLPRVLYVAGTTDFVNSLYELAVAEYLRAIELDPNYSDVYRFLGRVYELSGQTEKALAAYRQAVQIDPGNYRTYVFLGWFYNNSNQYSEALAPLRQAVALAPAEPIARDYLAFAYKSLGQFEVAEAELRTALKSGETVLVLDQLGETLMYDHREVEAVPEFERALAINPNDEFALMDLGICHRRLGRPQEAARVNRRGRQAAEAAKILNPRLGITRAYLAYFDSQLARQEADPAKAAEAESEILQAVRFSPDGAEVRWMAVLTYEALGKRPDALAVLTSASPELLADLNRWPDLAPLQQDKNFTKLLISNQVW